MQTRERGPPSASAEFLFFFFSSTAIQLVTLSTCILIRINSATGQEPVCTTILPTAAWLSVDWQTGFHDANSNGGPHSGTPILFFIVGFPPQIGLFQTVFIFIEKYFVEIDVWHRGCFIKKIVKGKWILFTGEGPIAPQTR